MRIRRGWGVVLVVWAFLAGDVWGAGFEYPENLTQALGRGGAAVASVDNAGAVYLNPAALTRVQSWSATVSANISDYRLCLERSPFRFPFLGGEASIEYEEECNQSRPYIAPMAFGALRVAETPLVLGVGVYGPSANGRLSFRRPPPPADPSDPNDPGTREPSVSQRTVTRQGGTAYMLTEMDTLVFYPSLAAAWSFDDLNLSIGVTGQLAVAVISYGLAVDAAGIPLGHSGPVDSSVEEESQERPELLSYTDLSTSGVTATAIFGLLWEPIPALSIGAAWRPRHKLRTQGTLDVEFPPGLSDQHLALTGGDVELDIQFPHVFRMGIQYRHLQGERMLFDVELAGTLEMWSDLQKFDVRPSGRVQDNRPGEASGSLINRELGELSIVKNYQDAWSVRLGGAWHGFYREDTRRGPILRLGGFFERGATDEAWAHLDYFSPDRVGFTGGLSWIFGNLSLDFALMHTLDTEMTVSSGDGRFELLNPLWVCEVPQNETERDACAAYTGDGPGHAINEGRFRHGLTVVSLGLSLDF